MTAATAAGGSSNGRSRVLSRRRQLSDTRGGATEGQSGESRGDRKDKNNIYFWGSILLLQASLTSSCIAMVFLAQGLRSGAGPQPSYIIWLVLSLSASLVGIATTYVVQRRGRELRRRAAQATIMRLTADVDVLVQQNIELQIMNRRSRDHGSISSRRASPLGIEDFASYQRFQERGMDVGVKLWLEQVGMVREEEFVDVRGGSWFGGSRAGSEKTAPATADGNNALALIGTARAI